MQELKESLFPFGIKQKVTLKLGNINLQGRVIGVSVNEYRGGKKTYYDLDIYYDKDKSLHTAIQKVDSYFVHIRED